MKEPSCSTLLYSSILLIPGTEVDLIRNFQLLPSIDDSTLDAVQVGNLRPAITVAQQFLCDKPEGITILHNIGCVGGFALLRRGCHNGSAAVSGDVRILKSCGLDTGKLGFCVGFHTVSPGLNLIKVTDLLNQCVKTLALEGCKLPISVFTLRVSLKS